MASTSSSTNVKLGINVVLCQPLNNRKLAMAKRFLEGGLGKWATGIFLCPDEKIQLAKAGTTNTELLFGLLLGKQLISSDTKNSDVTRGLRTS